ncbi:MAG: EFR1 family ferrodoxin [Treponema sp.]|jgi:ferredoxin|nr:EFR1 family ferrodoxin [Treponema sp.]
MNNIIFCFSGTGNSLKVAKAISKELAAAEIVPMGNPKKYIVTKKYDTIGFVYPVYYWGLPNAVRNFVETIDLTSSVDAYFYGIATFGGLPGNGIAQLNELLRHKHNVKLNYGKSLRMFSNYIVAYPMSNRINEPNKKADKKIIPVLEAIKNKKSRTIARPNKLFAVVYNKNINKFNGMDRDYVVDTNCTGCGICSMVCPVKNIEMINKQPNFKHNCEQCVACIQYCPRKAINYKNLTQNRGRYTNPEISYKELSELNNG